IASTRMMASDKKQSPATIQTTSVKSAPVTATGFWTGGIPFSERVQRGSWTLSPLERSTYVVENGWPKTPRAIASIERSQERKVIGATTPDTSLDSLDTSAGRVVASSEGFSAVATVRLLQHTYYLRPITACIRSKKPGSAEPGSMRNRIMRV